MAQVVIELSGAELVQLDAYCEAANEAAGERLNSRQSVARAALLAKIEEKPRRASRRAPVAEEQKES